MTAKLLLPLAIGGGLALLLASSSSKAAGKPAGELPPHLKQVVADAIASGDPALMEQAALRVDQEGHSAAANGVRTLAAQARANPLARPAPASAPSTRPTELPPHLKEFLANAWSSGDPVAFERVAQRLGAEGFPEAARAAREVAERLRAGAASRPQTSAETTAPAGSAARPAAGAPGAVAATSEAAALPPELHQMVAGALGNGSAPALTTTAYVLAKAGFPAVAEELRARAQQVAAATPPPPAQDSPNVALDPAMPADLAARVARLLQLEGDPSRLESVAREIRAQGFTNSADQLEAKAQQILTALDAARTMARIDYEFVTPGIAESPFSTRPSAPATPSPATLGPAPGVITSAPSQPLAVPASPVAQQPPAEKSAAQILANTLATHLNELVEQHGGVPGARYKVDGGLVKRFQEAEGLKADGKYGAGTALRLARYVSEVPPPFFWRKGAGQRDLDTYRANLHTLAVEAEQLERHQRAQQLRASAQRASLA